MSLCIASHGVFSCSSHLYLLNIDFICTSQSHKQPPDTPKKKKHLKYLQKKNLNIFSYFIRKPISPRKYQNKKYSTQHYSLKEYVPNMNLRHFLIMVRLGVSGGWTMLGVIVRPAFSFIQLPNLRTQALSRIVYVPNIDNLDIFSYFRRKPISPRNYQNMYQI